jgi:CobQ-like glutamine amidotransferase family enzyme
MDGEVYSVLRVVVLYPELLGTYGDAGNGLVLAQRARRRGIECDLVSVGLHDDLPDGDVYLLGGGEDGPQRLACDLLVRSSFAQRVDDGAHVVAVCAGLQVLGHSFSVEGDDEYAGLGIVDVVTRRGVNRSVGEMAVDVQGRLLVGFENHGGRTILGEGLSPLGTMVLGRGNDGAIDGFRTGSIWATYAHGPVLAMNPWFCDEILSSLLGRKLDPLHGAAELLYAKRCAVLSPRARA